MRSDANRPSCLEFYPRHTDVHHGCSVHPLWQQMLKEEKGAKEQGNATEG